jgi:hypothetical protein
MSSRNEPAEYQKSLLLRSGENGGCVDTAKGNTANGFRFERGHEFVIIALSLGRWRRQYLCH